MNVNDIDTEDVIIPPDVWTAIWQHQKELHEKYKPIEDASGLGHGLLPASGFHIDDRFGQYYLKDMFWRVTEELCEAQEAHLLDHMDHKWEEMIDALHFMVEIFVVLDKPLPPRTSVDSINTTYWLGLAANCLKQKPWKQTHMVTDRQKFMTYINNAFQSLVEQLYSEFGDDEIYLLYFKKNAVNQFRQRSNY